MSEGFKRALEVAAKVDWARLFQMGGTLARSLRGDGEAIDEDATRARSAGSRMIDGFEAIGRTAVGCKAPGECSCGFCAEKKERG